MTIAENIAFGLKIKNKPKSYIDDKIKYALKLVNLSGLKKRMLPLFPVASSSVSLLQEPIVMKPRVLLR